MPPTLRPQPVERSLATRRKVTRDPSKGQRQAFGVGPRETRASDGRHEINGGASSNGSHQATELCPLGFTQKRCQG